MDKGFFYRIFGERYEFISFLVKRLLFAAFILFGLSILVFIIARVIPGDPARLALGPRAPEDVVERYRELLHLNDPIYLQYIYWLIDLFHGKLGLSLTTFRDVIVDISQFLPATLELMTFAVVIDVIFAFTLGILAGRKPGSWVDNTIRVISYVGIAVPAFVWAIIFQLVFGYYLKISPVIGRLSSDIQPPPHITGFITLDSLLTGNFQAFVDALWHIILPAFALSIGPMAQEARILRASMAENLNREHVLLMISHGIPGRTIYSKYLLKVSMIPVISVMGLDAASLINNAFLIEVIYNWPGISRYGIIAMLRKDLNAIVAVVLISGLLFAIANIIVDALVNYIDPRSRKKS